MHNYMIDKHISRSCMVALGSNQISPNEEKWPLCTTFIAFGHRLQHNGSVRACWSTTKTAMWKAFWANLGAATSKNLSTAARLHLLDTAVTPVFKFRCSRWPPQAQVIAEVDSLQRKMIATAVRLPCRAGEEIGEYCRRRGHNAGVVARCEGRWSMLWRQRVLAWDDHLHRDRNKSSWAAQLVAFKDRKWFAR